MCFLILTSLLPLQAGANVEIATQYDGRTPIICATINGHVDTVQYLLSAGALPVNVDMVCIQVVSADYILVLLSELRRAYVIVCGSQSFKTGIAFVSRIGHPAPVICDANDSFGLAEVAFVQMSRLERCQGTSDGPGQDPMCTLQEILDTPVVSSSDKKKLLPRSDLTLSRGWVTDAGNKRDARHK